jgi:hypothetical protein
MAGCVNLGVIHDGLIRTLGIDKHAPVFIWGVLTALVLAARRRTREEKKCAARSIIQSRKPKCEGQPPPPPQRDGNLGDGRTIMGV